jgi:hypothetical protein
MIAIQIVLIAAFLSFLFLVLANPLSYQLRAWIKILAMMFVLIAIITVVFPDSTNTVAHWLGVSRGADLLLYLLTLAFIFAMFNSYTQEKRLQRRIVLLARKLAILEANQRNKGSKKNAGKAK